MIARSAMIAAVLVSAMAASWPAYGGDPPRVDRSSGEGPLARSTVAFTFATHAEGHEILLSDVHVVIRCAVAGRVFEAVSDGPFLVADVPEGRYEVIASHEGQARRVAFSVARGEPRQVRMAW